MVARNFNKIPEVKEVDVVLGYYDVIGKVETSSHKELEKIVTRDIRKIENIQSSITLTINL
ncbi:MAG: Lrp/AsnC ligand binding domain-containing protein [Thaumarchaeota archaeon]|nr:Lrp/AsnC ligand binding domain-containing protein [Nitrososphaerota archaeon]